MSNDTRHKSDDSMLNEPRVSIAIALWMIAIITGSIGWTIKADARVVWLAAILILTAVVFGSFALIQTLDVMAYRATERMRSWQAARSWGVVSVANAVAHLTSGRQLEMVEQFGFTTMSLVPGEQDPILFVDTPGGRVPHEMVIDFIHQSVATAPLLMPVRRGGQPWREAQMITALIVAHGWAAKAAGPHRARLTIPIEELARRLWVDISIPAEEPEDQGDTIT